jgi:hypothetical protein
LSLARSLAYYTPSEVGAGRSLTVTTVTPPVALSTRHLRGRRRPLHGTTVLHKCRIGAAEIFGPQCDPGAGRGTGKVAGETIPGPLADALVMVVVLVDSYVLQ